MNLMPKPRCKNRNEQTGETTCYSCYGDVPLVLGGIVVPLFTLFGADGLRYRLENSGAKALGL